MSTTEEIKIVLPKGKPQGYWMTKEGREEKEELSKAFDALDDEGKLQYNKEAEIANNGGEPLEKPQTINTEERISMTPSELDAYLDRKLEEKLKAVTPQASQAKVDSPAVTQIKNELFDDLPEIRNFKERKNLCIV